ncbi:VWA domain-containing protein [bacterium]|nr:VWA domain-containing protein [bacterium]
MKRRNIISSLLFGMLLCMLLFPQHAVAQPRLDLRLLKPNTPDYYYYQLYFAAYCGDSVIYDLDKGQLILEEDIGLIDTSRYTIDRPASPDRNSCYELAMVFDNSNAISPADLTEIASASAGIIDSMNRDCQRSAVLTFADHPTLLSFLTSEREQAKAALDGMTPGGSRALYDGIYTGVSELRTNGIMNVRIVLVLTTGGDQGSTTDQLKLLQHARGRDIRIFIVELGSTPHRDELEFIARETGGLYYHVTSVDELGQLYATFPGFFRREFDEHRIVRRTANTDMKNLLIRLRLEACQDSVWAERLFHDYRADTVISAIPPLTQRSFTLGQSWPNPVSASGGALQIRFEVLASQSRTLSLLLYNGLGQQVATLMPPQLRSPGAHTIQWRPSGLPPGVYYYRLTGGKDILTGKMTVIP